MKKIEWNEEKRKGTDHFGADDKWIWQKCSSNISSHECIYYNGNNRVKKGSHDIRLNFEPFVKYRVDKA